jgi:hypothetical protein
MSPAKPATASMRGLLGVKRQHYRTFSAFPLYPPKADIDRLMSTRIRSVALLSILRLQPRFIFSNERTDLIGHVQKLQPLLFV